MSRFLTRPNLALAAIVLVAAFFRFFRIDRLPPGFQFDQAFYVFDSLRLLQGEFSIFFREPGRSEPLYQYLMMVGVALFGDKTPLSAQVTGATISVLTIPLIYGMCRTMFKSVGMGLLTALFVALSLWQVFYGHYGERLVLTVFMSVLVFWFFWRAISLPDEAAVRRGEDRHYFSLTGIFTGLALCTYPSARIIPLALVILTAYAMLADRANARWYFKGLIRISTLAIFIFLPLAVYYLANPIDFISHANEVSIFTPHGEVTGNVVEELAKNALRILGMFFVVGDAGILRNLPYRPIFDPLVGALFVAGVVVWLSQLCSPRSTFLERRRAVVLGVWLGLALALSLFSDDAPNNARVMIGMPVVMIVPAWGTWAIWNRLNQPNLRRVGVGVLGCIVLTSGVITYRDYFITFANYPGLAYAYQVDKAEVADWLNRNALSNTIYIAPVTQAIGTVSLLTRNAPLKSFDSRDTIVLPNQTDHKDAVFVFPLEQEKKIETMAARLGSLGTREDVTGSDGARLLFLYRVPIQNLPDAVDPLLTLARGGSFVQPQAIERAVWADSLELLGYSVDAADPAKRNLEVTLFFHALKPMADDYTFSVKVRDAQDRVWGQEDKWAGDNSYATTQWSPGEVIIEKFYPGLNACAPAGDYRITVEAYDPKTAAVLGLLDLGMTRADASPGNLYEHLEPAQTIDVQVAPQARLLGYTLTPGETRAGDAFALALFWRGVDDGSQSRQVSVRLRDAAKRDFVLADPSIRLPVEGRGLCAFFDLTTPQDAADGTGALFVNDTKITSINITR